MDDRFLYQLREQPNPGFAKSLRQELTQYHSEPERRLDLNSRSSAVNRKATLGWITALIALIVLAVMAISPVKAFVSSFIIDVAGQVFEVTEDYPGDNYPGKETIFEPQVMSLGEALAVFPYSIKLPTNISSEFSLSEENVRVYVGEQAGPFANTIEIQWVSDTQSGFDLRITDRDLSVGEIVAPDSVEEIFLDDDHPAVVIQGGWDADKKVWNYNYGIRLRWSVDNLTYDLWGIDREQLIEIALSTFD